MHLCRGVVTRAKAIEVEVFGRTIIEDSLSLWVVPAFQHYSSLQVAKNNYGDLRIAGQVFDLLTGSDEPHRTAQMWC